MILKKPYAFLIRHFRLIHLILAIPLIYISRKTRLVVDFFKNYVANKYTFQTGSDISGIYISGIMLFAIFVIIVATLAIYYLLKYKEKPVKMYVTMIVFYIVLFGMLFYISNVISNMAREVLAVKSARMFRDISLIIYFPQFFFIIFVALRAIGFNIKQFNFQSDLKELEITSEDNEEVEVELGLDGYKTKRFFRRFKREFSYYLIENKFMVTVSLIIILFSGILVYYNTRQSYNSTYRQKDKFLHQGFQISVKDSIVTDISFKGTPVDGRYYYLALKVNAINNMNVKTRLDYASFIVTVNGKKLKPILDRSDYFVDYGEPYKGDFIKPNVDQDYVLVYRLDKEDVKKDFKLKVLSSFDIKKDKIITRYAIVNLTPVIIDTINNMKTVNLKSTLNFSNTNIGATTLTVKDYKNDTSYTYEYEYCYTTNNCTTKKDIVTVDYRKSNNDSSLLILDADLKIDKSTSYGKYIRKDGYFYTDFVSIADGSINDGSSYNVIDVTPSGLKDKIVLQVNGDIKNISDLDMYVTIRNKRYIINLN